jgi:ABC-2 type transport system permease protein
VVGIFARLKLRLLAGNVRSDTGRQVGFALSTGMALIFGTGGFLMAVQLRLRTDDVAPGVAVVAFTVLAFGWCVLPVLAFGVDETLDPARLALLPLRRRDLMAGLLASSLVGLWPAATALILVGLVIGAAPGPGGVAVGVVSALLMLALCVCLARAITTSLAGLLRSRRGRDLMLAVGLGVTILAQMPNLVLNGTVSASPSRADFDRVVDTLEWAPPGMAARAMVDTNPLWLVPVALVVVLVGRWWMFALERQQVGVDASTAAMVRRRRWNPRGPQGGVTLKELAYLRRDPRRTVGLITGMVMTVVLTFTWGADGAGPLAPVGFGALLLAMQSSNLFGSDGNALWMNVVTWSGWREIRTDLAGRQVAYALVAVPALVPMSIASGLISSSTAADVAEALLVGWTILGLTLAATAVTSVRVPFALPDRANSFSGAAPGQGGKALASSLTVMLSTAVLGLPIWVLLATGAPGPFLVLGPVYGGLLAWAGRTTASRVALPRLPEIVSAVSRAN